MNEISDMVGKTAHKVINNDNEELIFHFTDNTFIKFFHYQDCCENVRIDEIHGDLDDLINSPITLAEEVSREQSEDAYSSQTWTFYKFATVKGYVTVKWLGESNGYYSEDVDYQWGVSE